MKELKEPWTLLELNFLDIPIFWIGFETIYQHAEQNWYAKISSDNFLCKDG